MSCAMVISAAMLDRIQKGRGCWWIWCGRSIGDPFIESRSEGSRSSRRSDCIETVRCWT